MTVEHRRPRRFAGAITVVAVLMTGCTSTIQGRAAMPSGPPPTLPCSDPHGGEIAKVVDVPDSLDGPFPGSDDLDSDAWTDLLYGEEGCGEFELANSYLGARERDNLLVDTSAYLPKRGAWEAGARWLACAVEYETGALQDANAPGLMAQAMHGAEADSFRECWFGPQIVFDRVPCSQPHEAEPTGGSVSAEPGTPYPTDPLARQPLVEACANAVVNYLEREIPNGYAPGIYLPAEQDWDPFPEVRCVILDSDGQRTTGSAVNA